MTADLFDMPTIERGRARGRAGMEAAAAAADRAIPGWCEMACEAVRRFAAAQHCVFTMEMARAVLAKELPTPPRGLRSWGKVTVMAKDRDYIVHTGSYFPAASSNGSLKPVYRRGLGAMRAGTLSPIAAVSDLPAAAVCAEANGS